MPPFHITCEMGLHPYVRRLAILLVCVALTLQFVGAGAETDPITENQCTPEKFVMFPDGWPKILDSRIYWFGPNNQVERATGSKSQFYDPTRKTIIFMDGFNGLYHVQSCHRMTSKCVPLARCEPGFDLIADPWVLQGWNFGMFFWDQFADEDCYHDAEMKVWGYVAGGSGPLTWKSYDKETQETERIVHSGPEASVGQVCATAMRSAMPTFAGDTLRIVGFSLGAQLAAACADVIYQQPDHPAKPTLAVLLEPAFTSHIMPWSVSPFHACSPLFKNDNEQTVRWTVEAVQRLSQHNVTLALYKSSQMTRCCGPATNVFNPGTELDVLGTLVRWSPTVCGLDTVFQIPCEHDLIVPFYFFSLTSPSLGADLSGGPTSGQCKMPLPSCTDAEIHDMAIKRKALLTDNYQPLWKQVGGFGTWTVADDAFTWDTSDDPDVQLPVAYRRRYDLRGFSMKNLGRRLSLGWALPVMFALVMIGCIVLSRTMRQRGVRYVMAIEGEE